MKTQIIFLLLSIILASCASVVAPAPTEVPVPTATSTPVSPTPTSTAGGMFITVIPTPMPTQPTIPVITPDAEQVKRWREYELALGGAILKEVEPVLCEWEILGRSDQEVFVWAVCMSTFSIESIGLPYHAEMPVAIHIGEDGAVQSVEIPGGGSSYAHDIRRMFPPDAQERYFGRLINFQALTDHLRWRRSHTEKLPLIVISSTPMP